MAISSADKPRDASDSPASLADGSTAHMDAFCHTLSKRGSKLRVTNAHKDGRDDSRT